ncbi:hypothetical protein [Ramlibacter montanisoli]|uniref:hypothetical protein n=1 Tax=Ramlibacter montanisoli TaxID=2732512 RepID=UPI00209C6544|nr:hypothetical protein [Ramlibacter montanisoli]
MLPPAPRWTRRALLLAGAAASLPARAQQRAFTLGLLTQADDSRYAARALQQAFPDAPSGRSAPAAELALNDSLVTLQLAGWSPARLLPVEAASAADLAAATQRLLQRGTRHILLELPAAGVAAVAAATAGRDVILFNTAAPEDALRGAQCAPHLLHTLPSHAMQMDAIAQLLVARKWIRPLVLVGPLPGTSCCWRPGSAARSASACAAWRNAPSRPPAARASASRRTRGC